MKILVVSNMYPSEHDPSYGTFVKVFVEGLNAKNRDGKVQLSVICGRTTNVLGALWRYLVFYFRTFFLVMFNRYDIIYVHTISFPIIPLRVVALVKKLPLVFNVHGGDVLTEGRIAALLKKWARPLVEQALMIVAPSAYFKEVVLQEFSNVLESRVFVSPSGGVDKAFYKSKKIVKVDSEFTIGYLSRIGKGKGWETFLKTVAILRKKDVRFSAIVAGRGPQKMDFLHMLDQLNLQDIVRFIDLESVPHHDLPAVYCKMDLFVFPTYYNAESLGLVGIEAMACRLPVIGSQIGAVVSYLKDGYNGFCFEPGNEQDLAAKVLAYMSLSDEEKLKLADNAYVTASQYEADYVASALYKKLQSLVD